MNIMKNILKENCKRFAVVMFAAFLAILPLTTINVYADSENGVIQDKLHVYAEGRAFPVTHDTSGTGSHIYWYVANCDGRNGFNSNVPLYGFAVNDEYYLAWTNYQGTGTQTNRCVYLFGWGSAAGVQVSSLSLTDGGPAKSEKTNGFYYASVGGFGGTYESVLTPFSSINDALEYLVAYENGEIKDTPVGSVYSYYDIENGYLSVIDLGESGAEYEVTLRTEMPILSEWLTGKFRYSNQTYWFADSWPTTETQIPNNGATLIEWERYGNRNYMGQTKNATATLTGTSSGRYMYIYNPAGQPNPSIIAVYQANMSMMENNTVHVTVEGSGLDIRVYNSQGSYSASVGGVSGSIVANDDYGQATTTTSGGAMQMTVSGGGIYTQTSGGANDVGLVQSVQNYLDGIQSTLTQFMNNVVSLLTTPIEYISSLIQQGGTFVSNIGQFWNWLPSPLPQYLITAILVVISIGIFHTFL